MSTNKSGIKLLPFHPKLVDLFPKLTDDEFNDLVADIEKHGQRVEIDIWNGQIIDGKHRALACQKLGIEPRYRERRFESEISARDYVVSLNFHHRHLSSENKRLLIAAFADWSKSDRANADALKTSKDTIRRVRQAVEKKAASEEKKASTGAGAPVEKKRIGKDGKARKQPAKKAAKVEPKQTAAAKVEPKPIEPKPVEPERVLDQAAEAERRVEEFLHRAQEAIRGARLDDLSGLTITREMIEATFGVLTAWGDIIRGMYDAPAMQDYEAAPVAPPPATNGSCGDLGAVEIAPAVAAGEVSPT
jgi:hypothetical protein